MLSSPLKGTMVLALALSMVGMAPSVSLADRIQAQPIYAHNNTGLEDPIWVAALLRSRWHPKAGVEDAAGGKLPPGSASCSFTSMGRYIFFNARDDQGHVWGRQRYLPPAVRNQGVKMFASGYRFGKHEPTGQWTSTRKPSWSSPLRCLQAAAPPLGDPKRQ